MFLPGLALAIVLRSTAALQDGEGERPASPVRLVSTIELAGVDGRLDHLALDRERRRVFVAAVGNGSVEVVDLEIGTRSRSLPGFAEPHAVLVLDAVNRVLVACGGSGTLEVLEGTGYERVGRVEVGADADNLRFDPRSGFCYVGVGEGEGGALAIVDTEGWKLVDRVALGGHPESFHFDAKSERAFVNVPSKRAVLIVDLTRRRIAETWPLEGAEGNYPMALQGADRRLFVACRKPPCLLVFDPAKGRLFETLPLGADADDVQLDEASGRVFVACGAGSIDVFERGELGRYGALASVATRSGARTCVLSPGEEKLYVAVPRDGDSSAEIRIYDVRP